jgi:hypothetical protein
LQVRAFSIDTELRRMTDFNPQLWLETAVRGLKDYAVTGFNDAVLDDLNNPTGSDVYEIVMEFPSDELINTLVPGKKTLIHFELDDIRDETLSFGRNIAAQVYDNVNFTLTQREGRRHILNFDVGIWTWDKSGGTTARLRAREVLSNLFTGGLATENLRTATDGGDGQLELLSFAGGHFITEAINEVRVFRMVNANLMIRVFSRTPSPLVEPTVEEVLQDPTELVLEPNIQL